MSMFNLFKKDKKNKDLVKNNDESKEEVKNIERKKYEYVGEDYLYTNKEDILKEIKEFEEKTNIIIPNQLRDFYLNYGYGFIGDCDELVARLLSPLELLEFINREDFYEFIHNEEFYKEMENNKQLIFIEYTENDYLGIGIGEDNNGKIYFWENDLLCPSFNDLIKSIRDRKNLFNKEEN